MTRRKLTVLVLTMFIATACLAGCGNQKNNDKISIVCTVFPEYDWVRNIIGDNDNIELTLLLDNGADLHNYQPTAADIVTISTCDMFIYVGGESDNWVNAALAESQNDKMIVINMMDALGNNAKEEEIVEGMEEEAEEDEEGGEEAPEYDEHIWLSLKNAEILVKTISSNIEILDPDNKEAYANNTQLYLTQLEELDNKYQTLCENAKTDTLLFGDRFPFRYLVEDYNLNYYAAFVGCSAESEASFETITFLAGKVDELGLNSVCTIETSDGKIANTIIENTAAKNADIVTFDSMQSATLKEIDNGITYIKIMEDNYNSLDKALN